MSETDLELEGWKRQWQSQQLRPDDLARSVEAGTRVMRRSLRFEIINTIVMGGTAVAWAVVSNQVEVAVLAVAVWIFIAIAWTASLLLRRGAWEPVTATTMAFIEISILRCTRNLQAIWIQAAMYVVILTFDLIWLYDYHAESSLSEFLMRPPVLVFLFIVTPLVAAAALRYRSRLLRELKNLQELRRAR